MCFTHNDAPSVFREAWPTARKQHVCCECRLPILPGERYQSCFGVWDFGPATMRTCAVCAWFRERVGQIERQHGCPSGEDQPHFDGLWEAIHEATDHYGLFPLDCEFAV